jgi:AraC-like DNA-binding protein/quercetin dioxygenase-like cupin family protein
MLGSRSFDISRRMDDDRREMDNPAPPSSLSDPLALRPVHGEQTARPVVAHAQDMDMDAEIAPHSHRRGQLLHAIAGVMLVRAAAGSWVVPTGCAVWVPPRVVHQIRMGPSPVAMRTVFVDPGARAGLWPECQVVEVAPLLRELIVSAVALPLDYPTGGREERLMQLILDEIQAARPLALHVPMPRHAGLARLCRRLVSEPATAATQADWAAQLHMHPRTFARLFLQQTGMGFGAWCRQARMLLSVPQLAAGASVLEVALAHGYDSPSAFSASFRRTFGVPPSAYLRR